MKHCLTCANLDDCLVGGGVGCIDMDKYTVATYDVLNQRTQYVRYFDDDTVY